MSRRVPTTWKGVVAVLAVATAVVILIFASTRGGILLGLLLVGVVALLLYALGWRVDKWLRERPIFGRDR